jgi:molybdenum cofactor guanylyltransferase
MSEIQSIIDGLVLAGGKSLRMGRDKSAIPWHGRAQKYYMADLLKTICRNVFISQRQDQPVTDNPGYEILTDSHTGIGPYGAILSAFAFRPGSAWLVVACDLPLLTKRTLDFLLANRDDQAIATTFKSPYDGLPEPLITIWEPRSYQVLLTHLSQGYTCPRKVLIRSNAAHIILPPDPDALMNVNTPDELVKAERIMNAEQGTI